MEDRDRAGWGQALATACAAVILAYVLAAGVSFIAALLTLAVTDPAGALERRLTTVLEVGVPAFAAGYLVGGALGAQWITRALARRRLTYPAALAAMLASAIPPAAAVVLGRTVDAAPRGVAGLVGIVELVTTIVVTAWVIRIRTRPLERAPVA